MCGWVKEAAKMDMAVTISTHCHWIHNANVKFVDLQLGNDSKTV